MKKLFLPVIMIFIVSLSLSAGQSGYASWYGGKFHGRKTANGEVFDTYKYTAAHKTLPFDTVLKVINLDNGKSTIVRINDRGPFIENRIIDLSFAAAREIGMIESGVARVSIEIVEGNGEKAVDYVYKIQVAAYSIISNVEKTVLRLEKEGIKPVIEKTDSGIYRVVLSGIEKEDIERLQKLLYRCGFKDYLLKKEIKL
ncbi:MAG: septal ring lytic transglycosylase RlpA family protein [Spirochaetia bacterium]|jgi:rare lipoprotein A|nr:septal ring lytic transglycosylase RlpA family protein [Spirochaetia bacterium]